MPAKALMIQGTGSDVGKSVLVAALCRIFTEDGYRVVPFKAQNMSNNADVTPDGGEISRAQAEQARACRVVPTVAMNPILLKPTRETGAQLIVLGKPAGTLTADRFPQMREMLQPTVLAAFEQVRAEADLVILEGAGSPAEINLREGDLVNMAMARAAQAPVLLVGDIDRGGVFAHLVGTLALVSDEEQALVRGFLINKFRGDRGVLAPGLQWLEMETGRPVVGVIPYLHDLAWAEEDSVPAAQVNQPRRAGAVRVEIVRLPRMANFTDFAALAREPDVQVTYVDAPDPVHVPDAVIVPGSKSTVADLASIRARGFADYLQRSVEAGAEVVGICGGFQMLGRVIRDPDRVEAEVSAAEGLGFLDVETVFHREKLTTQVQAAHLESGLAVTGYEIHMGRAVRGPGAAAVLQIGQRHGQPTDEFDGAVTHGGRVWGTHLHGLFDNAGFRAWWLNRLRRRCGVLERDSAASATPDDPYARLAAAVRPHLQMGAISRIVFG